MAKTTSIPLYFHQHEWRLIYMSLACLSAGMKEYGGNASLKVAREFTQEHIDRIMLKIAPITNAKIEENHHKRGC